MNHKILGYVNRNFVFCAKLAVVSFIITLLGAFEAKAMVVTQDLFYKDGPTQMRGTLVYDSAVDTKRPGVVIFPEWWGNNDYAKRRAKDMAESGHIVLVADMYGEGKVTTKKEEAMKLSTPLYEDRSLMRRRARLALDVLRKQKDVDRANVAAVGFCMGGTVALELARQGSAIKGAVAFHAGLKFPDRLGKNVIKAKILVLNGADDPMVPLSENQAFIEEMQAAGTDTQLVLYSGAAHAYTNPSANKFHIPGVAYNAKAEKRAFDNMESFFNEIFAK